MQPKYWVIIPAAGKGYRFGAMKPKQYLTLQGKSILEHTLAKFLYHPKIEKIVVVVNNPDYYWQQLGLEALHKNIMTTEGGVERCHSVLSALEALQSFVHPKDFVLVHDAVRPCVNHYDINSLIDNVGLHPVGGILGARVRDTLKRSNDDNEIVTTVSRENIWQALTPQMFRFQLLMQAMQEAIAKNNLVTDEAAAIEALGFVPMIVEGRQENIKLTYEKDLKLVEKYL